MKNRKSKATIIILHGWGLRGAVYNDLDSILEKEGYHVYSPDLPGFGAEPLQNGNMNLDDYVEFVRNFLKKTHATKTIFIGHSFGGRVALKYAWRYPKELEHLILTGVPIIRRRSLIKKIVFVVSQLGGRVLRVLPKSTQKMFLKATYFFIGEWDYYKAGSLKQVFINIIDEDLIRYAKETEIKTVLVWGKNDRLVPVEDVAIIKKLMPQAESVIVENTGHKLPYDNPNVFYLAIEKFL